MKIENNGLVTYYETYGNPKDDALILLHGIGADNNMWMHQKERYSNEGYFVVVLDLLCHGKSSKVESLTLDDWSNQIKDLMESLNVLKATVVGVSMGGVIAQHFAVTYPTMISNLVLSDTFAELKSFREKMLAKSQVIGFKMFKILGNKMLAKGMESTYKQPYASDAKEYFGKVSLEVDFDQMVIARRAINQVKLLSDLPNVKVPCLVMVGDQFGKSFIDINKKIAEALSVELVIINDSMDPSNLVNPKVFDEKVLGFLESNSN